MPDGTFKPGVFVFRTLEDCRRIAEYAKGKMAVTVIGGGLLGLEAARGFEAEQPSADHGNGHLAFGVFRDAAAIFERAKHKDAGLERSIWHGGPFHLGDEGTAASGDDQLVVGLGGAVFGKCQLGPPQQPSGPFGVFR